jgi:hypothetical protein
MFPAITQYRLVALFSQLKLSSGARFKSLIKSNPIFIYYLATVIVGAFFARGLAGALAGVLAGVLAALGFAGRFALTGSATGAVVSTRSSAGFPTSAGAATTGSTFTGSTAGGTSTL